MKAVELYIKYDQSAADTVRELGYPDRKMLVRWYKENKETGKLHERYDKNSTYTLYQMNTAVNYYLEHGRSITRTIKAVGFPMRETLSGWIDELAPGVNFHIISDWFNHNKTDRNVRKTVKIMAG
ncbi:hypothetical protein ACIZ62_18535 [Acetobacterium carbinolicum]|uniref:hypothetical protein n=1 Tax=Acetobacterium carbinolicum TaxID=52690 RepID=UPI0039BEEF8E